MRVKFICGCVSPEIVSRENLKTMDSVALDDEGMLICAQHHFRRYGWASLPKREDGRADFSVAGWSPLQIQNYVVFGELPTGTILHVKSTAPDLRDNRDPEMVALARARRRVRDIPQA